MSHQRGAEFWLVGKEGLQRNRNNGQACEEKGEYEEERESKQVKKSGETNSVALSPQAIYTD
jgi:hypothetical protein